MAQGKLAGAAADARRLRRRSATIPPFFWLIVSFVAFVASPIGIAASAAPGAPAGVFKESLSLKPLADGRLYSFFAFTFGAGDLLGLADGSDSTLNAAGSKASGEIFHLVPRSLIHLARGSNADEVHLAINAGRWDYSTWGTPVGDDMVGTGAELWARLRGQQRSNRENNTLSPQTIADWRRLTADLAGLFCASLDALDEKLTTEPLTVAQGREGTQSSTDSSVLRAMLASESICTENLSTLLKLLPCKTQAGIAGLLEPHHFFMSDFHGMALHLERKEGEWHVRVNVQAVFSPVLQVGLRANRNWSLQSIFGKRLTQSCPLADRSSITVFAPPDGPSAQAVTDDTVDFNVWPVVISPHDSADIDADDELSDSEKLQAKCRRFSAGIKRRGQYTFDTTASKHLNVEMRWPGEGSFIFPRQYLHPSLTASRILSGYGQERGTVEVTIKNTDPTQERRVLYEEVLPWFMRPYLHTLQVKAEADEYDEDVDNVVRYADDLSTPLLVALNYTPSIPRERPFHLLSRLRIPPQSTVRLAYEYDKAFLRYAEHPPDAHRGFDIAPATITIEQDGSGRDRGGHKPMRLYTEPALVEVAVPDFSMPYNVIIFTSTLIALCAGSTLNNLVRKYTDLVEVDDADGQAKR